MSEDTSSSSDREHSDMDDNVEAAAAATAAE